MEDCLAYGSIELCASVTFQGSETDGYPENSVRPPCARRVIELFMDNGVTIECIPGWHFETIRQATGSRQELGLEVTSQMAEDIRIPPITIGLADWRRDTP
jgi:hypothetical protein